MTSGVLEHIHEPVDIQALEMSTLHTLAQEIRHEILQVMAANGGHLATNLGTVELSIALHYTLHSPDDKIIWDVGNQCYTHKILTGRRSTFHTIRKGSGLSGFVHRTESPHDHMTAGHAGTALSSALGIATARDQLNDRYSVVAIVGDGALTAGLSYEALNNISILKSQLLIILNDNSFSISPSCGGLAIALEQARAKILDGNIFEKLGLTYLGPIDGHDIEFLIDVFREAKNLEQPVVLHVLTQKGRGYAPAESDPEYFHGIAPFDLTTGKPYVRSNAPTYADLLGQELITLAQEDQRIVAITAAMTIGTGLKEFAAQYPERFFDVGIAEQHAVTFAAGLAVGGCRPVVAIYSTFLQRGYDQIIHDVCLQDLPVTFILDRAGIVGADGATHHGIFDLGYLRIVPRMVVMAPKDGEEFKTMLRLAKDYHGPAAIRIPRGAAPARVGPETKDNMAIGQGEALRHGNDIALIAIGSMVEQACEVASILDTHGISSSVINARFVKPLDGDLILATAKHVQHIFTLEEHVVYGGFGSSVNELLSVHHIQIPVSMLGLPDHFIEHGSAQNLLDECGLSVDKIVTHVLEHYDHSSKNHTVKTLEISPDELERSIQSIREQSLPSDLSNWIKKYETVGQRDAFLWKWCLEGVRLTTLPCIDPLHREVNDVTKVLGVMFDVLLDDVADRSDPMDFLETLLQIPFAVEKHDFDNLQPDRERYVDITSRLWQTIVQRFERYPRYNEFRDILHFDYLQLLNSMRYSHLINAKPQLLNMTEHDLYLPHNMHMMISGTLDLMCSSSFDRNELGRIREVLWHAQCMGRIGNLITTWERELGDADLTSGVFAYAMKVGAITPRDIEQDNMDVVRDKVKAHDCEKHFMDQWHYHHHQLSVAGQSIHSVNIDHLIHGLEKLFMIHMGSRGLK